MWFAPEMKIQAPQLGRAWCNTAPLALQNVRGRRVLVDLWGYTCSNCLRRGVRPSSGGMICAA